MQLLRRFAWNRSVVDRPDVAVDYSTTPPYQNNNDVKFAALSWRWSPSGTLTNELRGGLNFAPATFSTTQPLPSVLHRRIDLFDPGCRRLLSPPRPGYPHTQLSG